MRIDAKGPESDEETVIPLLAEELHVSKREVTRARVQVTTVTDLSEQRICEELSGQRVDVERVPIDILVEREATPPQPRTEEGVTIIPILEEVLVVEKRLLIKEELRITRQTTTTITDVPVTLRKQRAEIERLEGDTES